MEEKEILLVKELLRYEKQYLQMINDYDIMVIYKKIKEEAKSYVEALQEELQVRSQYDKALKTPKIDPFIAGGLGQGIGGVGAGIYAGIRTANTNEKISQNRINLEIETGKSSAKSESIKKTLMKKVTKIDNYLNQIPGMIEIRRKNRQEIEQQEKKTKNEEIKGAIGTFLIIGGFLFILYLIFSI